MSTVFDVTAVTVNGGAPTSFGTAIDNVLIQDAFQPINVTVTNPQDIETVEVAVPGIQGPPGLQNVFVSDTAPSSPSINDIWIEI